MGIYKTFRFFLALLRMSIRASISLRGAFLLESFLMIANNFIFLLMWWIFFRQFEEVSGWTLSDMIALNAIGMGGYGLMQICFGGAKQISRIILNGELDLFMTQPKDLLIHLIGSKSVSKGWGLVLTTVILVILGKLTSSLALILIGVICSCLVFASIGIIAHSLVFWFGSIETVSKNYCDSLFLFALYPTHIYSGVLQLIMFTLIPAGIIGYMPVELLRNFSWFKFITLTGCSIGFFCLAFIIFYRGLRHYESGNQFGIRL